MLLFVAWNLLSFLKFFTTSILSISLLEIPSSSSFVNLLSFEISFIFTLPSEFHVFIVESSNNVFKFTKFSNGEISVNSLYSKFKYSKFTIFLANSTLLIFDPPKFNTFRLTKFLSSSTLAGSALNRFKYSTFTKFFKGDKSFIP